MHEQFSFSLRRFIGFTGHTLQKRYKSEQFSSEMSEMVSSFLCVILVVHLFKVIRFFHPASVFYFS